jgi:hypothetical protein
MLCRSRKPWSCEERQSVIGNPDHLLTIFDVYDDESEAVDSFKLRGSESAVANASRGNMKSAITVH